MASPGGAPGIPLPPVAHRPVPALPAPLPARGCFPVPAGSLAGGGAVRGTGDTFAGTAPGAAQVSFVPTGAKAAARGVFSTAVV